MTNVANILKDKPQGTKLYDRATDLVVCLDNISTTDGETVIWCTRREDSLTSHYAYSEFGTMRGYPSGMTLLVPSKEVQDWEQWQKLNPEFKDGDIVYISTLWKGHKAVCIFRGMEYGRPTVYAHLFLDEHDVHIAPSDEDYNIFCGSGNVKEIRLATEAERTRLFDALAKQGKRWNAEAKRVEDLPKAQGFRPFDRVLVRDDDNEAWRIGFFSHMIEGNPAYPYCVISTSSCAWSQCIPYEGNESLVGTSDKPKYNYGKDSE